MAPPRALLVVAILLTGCQGATPPGPTDPFFGRTRIEPPHTGAASSGSSIAPYSPTPPQVTVPPAMTPVSGASSSVPSSSTLALAPVSEPIAVPAAARQMESPNQQIVSCVATSGDVRSDNSATSVSAPSLTPPKTVAPIATSATSSQQAITTRERVYQTISPRPKEDVVALADSATSRVVGSPRAKTAATGRPIDIMDLPPASDSAVRQVSAAFEIKDPVDRNVRTSPQNLTSELSTPPSLYGCDPQYGWLRGRLEYSQIDHQWKLRYIPIDGVTDQYGGSVILGNTTMLSGYERGDFVEVRGTLASTNPDSRTFSPTFEIRTIKPLRKQ